MIPAIDIIGGRCVRLRRGDYNQATFYDRSPLDQAKRFEALGYRYLHLVDLDGAREGHPVNLDVLNQIANNTRLIVDYGGGIRACEAAQLAFDSGASQVNLGTSLVANPNFGTDIISIFGSGKLIAAIDCSNYVVLTHGWVSSSGYDIFQTIGSLIELGFKRFTVTDIARDGMLSGPSVELYQGILERFPSINLRASGGVSSRADIEQLAGLNIEGVIVGRMLYEVEERVSG